MNPPLDIKKGYLKNYQSLLSGASDSSKQIDTFRKCLVYSSKAAEEL